MHAQKAEQLDAVEGTRIVGDYHPIVRRVRDSAVNGDQIIDQEASQRRALSRENESSRE